MSEKLSENFTLDELIYSDTAKAKGINNVPTALHKKILKHTCQYMLEKLRALLNEKYKEYKGKKVKQVILKVTSGYRGEKLNTAVGGASNSQHCCGEATDLEAQVVYTNEVRAVTTLSDPMDCSLPGSSIHGIFQARVLEWVAIAFSFVLFKSLQILTGLELEFISATLDIIDHFLSGSTDVYDALHETKWLLTILNFYQLSQLAPKKSSSIWSAIKLAF